MIKYYFRFYSYTPIYSINGNVKRFSPDLHRAHMGYDLGRKWVSPNSRWTAGTGIEQHNTHDDNIDMYKLEIKHILVMVVIHDRCLVIKLVNW
jgi:hypothetical protein